MAIKVRSIQTLKEYFSGVALRTKHHAPNISDAIYPLLGLIILNMDEDSDIEVRSTEGVPGNLLWVYIKGKRYAFRYEPQEGTIELREGTIRGKIIRKIDNNTSVREMRFLFEQL